jgi:hypothetical protein
MKGSEVDMGWSEARKLNFVRLKLEAEIPDFDIT